MLRRSYLASSIFLAACSAGPNDGPDAARFVDGSQAVDAFAMAPDQGAPISALGATVYAGGVHFAVWAPDADQVYVTGEFNGWSTTQTPLQRQNGGIWSADVAGAVAGQQFQYLIANGGDTLTRQDPYARQVVQYTGPSIVVDPASYSWTSTFTQPSRSEMVIYELHVGSFNVTQSGTQGTFQTTIDKLDYLAALGINEIELLPPAEFPGTSSWGYNPSLPFAVSGVYGSPDDLRRLVDQAHARGIGVIIDVVHNHYSGHNPPLACYDAPCNGSNDIYFYSDAARANTPWGPRPDFGRSEVRNYIRDNALFWLGEMRADGLRWDSVSNIRGINNGATANPDGASLLVAINDAIDQRYPHSLQIAEDLATLNSITASTQSGGLGFDSQWDAAFFHPVDDTVIAASDANRSMITIRDAIAHQYNGSATQRVIYSEDHDVVANGNSRIPQMIDPTNPGSFIARKRSTLAAAIALTSPGIPMLFMGQEFLEDGHFSDTLPLDWSKTTTYAGILALYTDLVHLRRNSDGTTAGLTGGSVDVFHVNDNAKVVAYHRWKSHGAGDDVVVVANFSSTPFPVYNIGLPSTGTWKLRFSSDAAKYGGDYHNVPSTDMIAQPQARDGLPATGTMSLAPYSLAIYSQ